MEGALGFKNDRVGTCRLIQIFVNILKATGRVDPGNKRVRAWEGRRKFTVTMEKFTLVLFCFSTSTNYTISKPDRIFL